MLACTPAGQDNQSASPLPPSDGKFSSLPVAVGVTVAAVVVVIVVVVVVVVVIVFRRRRKSNRQQLDTPREFTSTFPLICMSGLFILCTSK